MAYDEHQQQAQTIAARFGVLTVSDTRTPDTDKSGQRLRTLIDEAGHTVARYQIVRDEPAELAAVLTAWIDDAEVDAIVVTGGTGVAARDQTINVVRPLLRLELPGFGELFRALSYDEIGSGAMLSRAVGGVAKDTPLFALPGSTAACELAMAKLILPEIRHLLKLLG
jgi:molybdenum cofactor biosynthesis protein B